MIWPFKRKSCPDCSLNKRSADYAKNMRWDEAQACVREFKRYQEEIKQLKNLLSQSPK